MGLTDKFLVDTTNFEPIAEKLRTDENLPDRINDEYLEQHGYTNPKDLLILILFKELNFLNEDGSPTDLFKKFRNQDTAKEALTCGLIHAYKPLFKETPSIYKSSKEEVVEDFRKFFGDDKSEIILKYMANTFKTIVKYIGEENLESVLEKQDLEVSNIENLIKESAQKLNEGTGKEYSNESPASSLDHQDDSSKKETSPKDSDIDRVPDIISGDNGSTSDNATIDINRDNGHSAQSDSSDNDDEDPEKESEEKGEIEDMNSEEETEEEEIPDITDDSFQESELLEENAEKHSQTTNNINGQSMYVAKALVRKADLLYKLERYKEALPAFDEVFQRFANSDNAEYYNHASVALIKKMKIAEQLELNEELIPIYTNIIDRLSNSELNEHIKKVDHAYIKRAEILVDDNQDEQALNAIDQAIDHFKNSGRKPDFLAKAMYKKAELFEDQGEDEQALETYDALLETFDNN